MYAPGKFNYRVFVGFLAALLLVGCSAPISGVREAPIDVVPTEEPVTKEPTATEEPTHEEIMAKVRQATAFVLSEGSFLDSKGTQVEGYGQGSAFFIGERLLLTANHVVAGGGSWKVFVPGHENHFSATVLGYAECSDLALLKLTSPDIPDHAVLDLSSEKAVSGCPIYVAGYILEQEPERVDNIPDSLSYVIADGVVSSLVDGETDWASVCGQKIIKHNAETAPGMSGGPLVDKEGRVLGVSFANIPGEKFREYAVPSTAANALLPELRKGNNVNFRGVTGIVVEVPFSNGFALRVRSVVPGSAMDSAGVEPGDFIVEISGRSFDTNRITPYCDVVRSSTASAVIPLKLVRITDGNRVAMEGALNGKELSEMSPKVAKPAIPEESEDAGLTAGSEYESFSNWPLVMVADFEGINKADWPVGTYPIAGGEMRLSREDGLYHFSLEAPQDLIISVSPQEVNMYRDMAVGATIEQVSTDTNSEYGLVFRKSDERMYYFTVRELPEKSGGECRLRVHTEEGGWKILRDWKFVHDLKVGESNVLIVVARGSEIICAVNDDLIFVARDDSDPRTGEVGVAAGLFEGGGEISLEVDLFVVSSPE